LRHLIAIASSLVALAGCAATPTELAAVDTESLCVDFAQTVLTGESISINSFRAASGQQIRAALAARGATCAFPSAYLELARVQLQMQQQQQAVSTWAALRLLNESRPMPFGPSGTRN
jgi:hypothetical protein